MGAVTFREDSGTTKKARIEVDGLDAFEIEYICPDASDHLDADARYSQQGLGAASVWLCAKLLRAWSLPRALPESATERAKVLTAMDPPSALLGIYLEIRESGRAALKN
jgi:hypothetical protein